MSNQKGKSLSEFKSLHAPDPEVLHLREEVSDLKRKLAQNKVEKGEEINLSRMLEEMLVKASPVKIKMPKYVPSNSPVDMVLHLTDIHYGSVIEGDEVDFFGEFNPDIARDRIFHLVNDIINKVTTQRAGYNVPNLHIIGTGDYISGDIHQELQVTNAFPAPEQAVRCGYLLGGAVAKLSEHFEKVTVDMITLDNHGRMTKKPQASKGGKNNWGYVVAEIVKQHVSAINHINVNVHAKPSALINIGPEAYLAMHGHQIKGWAGKPYYGFDRRAAMEAIKRMGIPEKSFTKLLMGHFHHAFNGDTWMLGGSLSGTDAFDHSCGRFGYPHQTSWFVHPKHGEFDWTKWRLG